MTHADLSAVLERSRELGFLGPGDVAAHVEHAAGFVEVLESVATGAKVLDLGSGGGLPGLVVAVHRPDLSLTLLDANERRVAFLRDAVRQLDLGASVSVVGGRAETLARDPQLREQFDVAVARSFGNPAVTAECVAAFLRLDARLFVSEPKGSEDRWPAEGLAVLGLVPGRTHDFTTATIRELCRCEVGLVDVPRAVGVPAKRPRF
ncbi:MAG: RsmG family class I SAM-dependent methyltransferase [Microthrixaceae bacterium]|jgi:16S rRNA (guanine527-N7)-methyltransferase